jgi:hypothetical protein
MKSISEIYECKLVSCDFKRAVSWTMRTRNKGVKDVDSIFKQPIKEWNEFKKMRIQRRRARVTNIIMLPIALMTQ